MNKKIKAALAAVTAGLMLAMSGCAGFDMAMSDLKGSLVGNAFTVQVYDNYGSDVVQVHGKRVDVKAENTETDDEGNTKATSSVIDVTADGHDMRQVGNTVIFVEDGLKPVKEFETPKSIDNSGDGTVTLFDRNVNALKNVIGTPKTVVISSQLGIPIAVYAGDNVGVSVPDDLPKMTKLTIDGKALYIHRANYVIMDTAAL